jgi:hypothetical protein
LLTFHLNFQPPTHPYQHRYDEAVSKKGNNDDIVPPRPELHKTLLPADLHEEQKKLLSCPFLSWRRTDILAFVQATAQCGRHNYAGIASAMRERGCKNKSEDSVKQYSERFFTVGHMYLKKWSKYEARLRRAEEKNREMESIRSNMTKILDRYQYPNYQLALDPRLHPKTGHQEFTPSEDRFLAVWVAKHGLGRPEDLRREVRKNTLFSFDPIFLIRTGEELERRALKVVRSCIKEHARIDSLEEEQKASANAASAAMHANEISKCIVKEMSDLKKKYNMVTKKRPLGQRNTGDENHTKKKKKKSGTGSVSGAKPSLVPERLVGPLVKLIKSSNNAGIKKIVERFQNKYASANVSMRQLRMKIREVASKKTTHSNWDINETYQKYLASSPTKKRKTPVKSDDATSSVSAAEPDSKRPKKLVLGATHEETPPPKEGQWYLRANYVGTKQ